MSLENLWVVLVLVIGFLLSRSVSSIIGEYAKRLWFSRLEPVVSRSLDGILRWTPTPPPTTLEGILQELEAEQARMRLLVETLANERDELQLQVIRLRLRLETQAAQQDNSKVGDGSDTGISAA